MKRHVLIIENDQWLGEHYKLLLERSDFSVERVKDGHAAMLSVDARRPSVIVSNLLLDGPSLLALLHELQSYTDTAKIPVIACTSLVNISIEQLRPYGVCRLLNTATVHPREIIAAVKSVLDE